MSNAPWPHSENPGVGQPPQDRVIQPDLGSKCIRLGEEMSNLGEMKRNMLPLDKHFSRSKSGRLQAMKSQNKQLC